MNKYELLIFCIFAYYPIKTLFGIIKRNIQSVSIETKPIQKRIIRGSKEEDAEHIEKAKYDNIDPKTLELINEIGRNK